MDLWECALGFMDSQALLTAEELGVFDALAKGPRTPAELGEAVGIPEDSADRLLIALAALEIVHKKEGRFHNGPEAARHLVTGEPEYIGSMFRHVREDLYPLWQHFDSALRKQRPQWSRTFGGNGSRNEEVYEDPEALRDFIEGMHTITYPAAVEFARTAPELEQFDRVVDVGGASGAFLIALAQEAPGLEGTVVDLEPVRPIAESFFRRHGLEDRLHFSAIDFFEEPLPRGADAYSLGFVLHDWSQESGERLLANIAESARPGSYLIVGEYLLNENKTGPLYVARSNLNMLVAARGTERSAPEYARWIEEFGFRLKRIRLTSHAKHFLVAEKV